MSTLRILIRIAILFCAALGFSVICGSALDKPMKKIVDWICGLIRGKS